MLILPIAIPLVALRPAFGDPAAGKAPSVEVLRYDLAANQDTPELCFVLSESVARRPATPLESFVTIDPAITLSATPRNDRLCLTGFSFGSGYTVTLRSGLPGIAGQLAKDSQFRVDIPNRPPELGFAAPENIVLPRLSSDGLPIRSVNVPKIVVQLFHIADDNMILESTHAPLTGEAAAAFVPTRGERIWQGTVDPKGGQNQDTITMLPIAATVGALKPGLYVATVWPADAPVTGQVLPTQYFTISDLGLTAYRAPDSLLVAARSLATAAPAPGIDIALVARNNRELGRARTDGNGFARFDAGILQNRDGNIPIAVRAYGPAGEFAALRLGETAAVAGMLPRGDVALIHLDRASYRGGESVDILALLRTDQSAPIAKRPLTMTVIRPNGTIFLSQTLSDQGDGSYNFTVTIPETGASGNWRVEARHDGDGQPIGSASFAVDIAPRPPLSVAVNADIAVLDPAQPANVTVQTQTAEGQQAGNVPGELRVAISATAAPFPAFPGFSFGAVDEAIPPLQLDPVRFSTDGAGKASVALKIAAPPKATKPLEAVITARMLDAGGRAVERTIDVPVANHSLLLGVRAAPEAIFPAGQNAHFEMIAVSPDGARQEKSGTGWEILRQDWKPSWSIDGKRFAYRPAVKDTHIAGGVIDISANDPAMLDVPNLLPGRYRIEIFDPNGEAISSARFMVGWAVRNAGDPGDTIAIKPAKPTYSPGDGLDVFVKPPFESDIVLAPADPEIRDAVVQHVPAAGATMHLTLPRDAGIGTQLFATAIAPPDAGAPGLTRRAFGQILLPADPAPRNLDVKLDLPATATPQRTLSIPVTVAGAGEDAAYVRVALTDERGAGDGLEPDLPIDPLIARQVSMVTVVDDFGRLITATGLSSGAMSDRETTNAGVAKGPDSPGLAQAPLALYSGIVTLDKSGKGNVLVTLPDYAGNVRIKAQAWAANRSGQAEAELAIRYPLNVSLQLPAYLTPDDHADLTLALDNMDGPRGEYRITVHADGAVGVQDEAEAVVNLAEHEQRSQPVAVQAHGAGDGSITIGIKGPDGMAFERHFPVKVRANAPAIARHAVVTVKPGSMLAIDPALTANMRADGAAFSAAIGAGSDLDRAGLARELVGDSPESAEGIVAAATPFLTPDALLATFGLNGATAQLNRAVQSLAGYQCGDGGFSAFAGGQSDTWLTAYVVDFMRRAKARGAGTSDVIVAQALDYLALHAEPWADPAYNAPGSPPTYSQQALATAAYANQVLAASGRLNLFQLRYFSDRFLSQMRSPAGAAFIAAAFANLGDKPSAASAFARAAALPIEVLPADVSGSDLRDQALLNAVMAESGAAALPSIAAVAAKTATIAAAHRQFNAQEAAWLFRAGIAQTLPEARFTVKLGDKTVEQSTVLAVPAMNQAPPPIKNTGDTPIHVALTAIGAPAPGEPKDQAGYEVQRWFFDTSGKAVDPAAVHQGDLIVVVLTGRFTGQGDAHPVLYDPLPAGWTVEAAEIADPVSRYPWLRDLTGASDITATDGLFIASPHLVGDKHEFRLAYIVRAAVRGQFNLPGTLIEDRIQPILSARTAGARTRIDSPS
jgi:uncharacterized protein YfaS (alpha-2-macroglobulin family)